ncbi:MULTISPECIES: VOC family protein [unclassified Sphingobacterium]|uniref:VOC family protein n=1 Tax=unclassified Sphingobacterium TaxID=2609468 RepID=UPI00105145FB|nr:MULTISPECIES: VOC family protein [unclassified Sphingobacterium]MCS3554477.1 catechol 2,3-dioxygenase-like lactoylglutathione lyase family enzyme [Sphingobacterium sp. JUb21]TCR07468.1 glyoxalase/bleomycin resistance protein/dioxygenase superfamily protein [Sphingobacterium sp. JUb20]
MIKGLFETHIEVSNLENAITFYSKKMNLELAYIDQPRRIAFLWLTAEKKAMLGLWEKGAPIQKRHFAFQCDVEFVRDNAVSWLKKNDLKPYNFLKDDSKKPMVFAWMPALAIYFDDPDGNSLEFISMLDGKGQPEQGVLSYADWLKVVEKH